MINEILQRNSKPSPSISKLVNDKNEIETSPQDICNELNSFFVNQGPKMAATLPTNVPQIDTLSNISSPSNSFFCEPCTVQEIFQEIMNLNENKSKGIENIPVKFMKMSAEYISIFLTNLFNKCILIGIFPSKLKIRKS